jgi:hypothetical protein
MVENGNVVLVVVAVAVPLGQKKVEVTMKDVAVAVVLNQS